MSVGEWSKLKIPKKINKKLILRWLAAIAGAAFFVFLRPSLLPIVESAVGHAALFSTAITLPKSAIDSLKDRFAGNDISDSDSSSLSSPPPPSSSSVSSSAASSQPPAANAPPSEASFVPPPVPEGEPPEIPQKYQAPLVSLYMAGEADNPAFLHRDNIWLRNYTNLTLEEISRVLDTDCSLSLGDSSAPQVLIYHTHTTESYELYDNTVYDTRNSWRDTDNNNNMAVVGAMLTAELARYGVSVIHDVEQHDYPSYNGAYDRSRSTVNEYLTKYPSIKVVIDLHRDGIVQSDNTVLKPVVEIEGRQAAQLMIVAPCDDGSVGVPGWRNNLRFAAELHSSIEYSYPGLCRPIFFCYRNYNLGLTDGSLLFELGTNGNTLEEALYTAQLIAEPIANVVNGHVQS